MQCQVRNANMQAEKSSSRASIDHCSPPYVEAMSLGNGRLLSRAWPEIGSKGASASLSAILDHLETVIKLITCIGTPHLS